MDAKVFAMLAIVFAIDLAAYLFGPRRGGGHVVR